MGDFTMPSLGADMESGTLTQWLVKVGDPVHRGDIVAVVDTEKSTIEIEIFENGVVGELLVEEGENVPVGAVLARVNATDGAASPTLAPPMAPVVALAAAPVAAPEPGPSLTEPTPGPRLEPPPVAVRPGRDGFEPTLHSPVIRHLAEHLGVDLASVAGSGPGGEVTRADVEQASRAPTAPKPASPLARRLAGERGIDLAGLTGTGPGGAVVERDLPSAKTPAGGTVTPSAPAPQRQETLRRAIGSLMARTKREIPHYYLSTTIDAGAATAWLTEANLSRSIQERLVLPALLVKAAAVAVAKVPEVNGFFADGEFLASEAVHVGVAISLRSGGVIAPAIHDANRLSLDELMAKLNDLVRRARAGVLRSSEMSDPTITVTNLGDLGVESVFGVIYPPQVAIVGFGAVTERPVAKGGLVGARPCLTATLSADHRVSDGHRGGRYLAYIDTLLQEPQKL